MTTELDYLLGIAEQPDYDLETFVGRAKYFVEESSRNFLSVRGMLMLLEIVPTQEFLNSTVTNLLFSRRSEITSAYLFGSGGGVEHPVLLRC